MAAEDGQRRHVRDVLAGLRGTEKVGSLHHTVPRFYLERFALNGQLWVRDRAKDTAPGGGSIRATTSMGVRDFYTAVMEDTGFDAWLEEVLAVVEHQAAPVLSALASPLFKPRALDRAEVVNLSTFLAFQLVRGMKRRREIELHADWYGKTMIQGRVSAEKVAKVRVVLHPNEHLRLIGTLPETLLPYLVDRPVAVVGLDEPRLLTCDEPVIVTGDGTPRHTKYCSLSHKRLRLLLRKHRQRGKEMTEIIHFWPTRPRGIALAAEVILPLSTTRALVLGPRGATSPGFMQLAGDRARAFAAALNGEVIDNAYAWVAGHPRDEEFRRMTLPEPGPILNVCGGWDVAAEGLRCVPSPHAPQRLRKSDALLYKSP